MLLNRRFHMVKKGCVEKAAALVLAELRRTQAKAAKPHKFRVCGPVINGPFDSIMIEVEYDDLEDYVRSLTSHQDTPEYQEYHRKWFELGEPGGTSELWVIAE